MSGSATASFLYDGDGQRFAATINGVTTVYIGEYFEWQPATGQMSKYYFAGGQRIAMRVLPQGQNTTPLWLFGDHLGSTSVVANNDGSQHSRQGYMAWGEARFSVGTIPTKNQYTGQISHEAELGLYFYKARYYNPALSRWMQPDTLVPELYSPLDYDRYGYVRNNPLMYNDPSGHWMCDIYDPACAENSNEMADYGIMLYESGLGGNNPGSSDPNAPINNLWSTDIHVSGNQLRFTVQWEGFSDEPYLDSNGHCTIGYGHKCDDEDLSQYDNFSLYNYWELFLADIRTAESAVRKAFQDMDNQFFGEASPGYPLGEYVPLNQSEFDAFVDFSFNAGGYSGYVLITTEYITSVNGVPTRSPSAIQNVLLVTQTGDGGIAIRREQEWNIFSNGVYDYEH